MYKLSMQYPFCSVFEPDMWCMVISSVHCLHMHYTCRWRVQARPCLLPVCSQPVHFDVWEWIALWAVSTVCIAMQWTAKHVSDSCHIIQFAWQISNQCHQLCFTLPCVAAAMAIACSPRSSHWLMSTFPVHEMDHLVSTMMYVCFHTD